MQVEPEAPPAIANPSFADAKEKQISEKSNDAPVLIAEEEDAAGHGRNTEELPYSKARLVALVATVTGAAFLNVS
jgi:hypothetical protein